MFSRRNVCIRQFGPETVRWKGEQGEEMTGLDDLMFALVFLEVLRFVGAGLVRGYLFRILNPESTRC
jgi:hypothetical protein